MGLTLPWAHCQSIVKARVKTGEEVRGGREVTGKGQCESLEIKNKRKWGYLLLEKSH